MKDIDDYRIEDNILRKKEKSMKLAFVEDLRTILATELELEVWRRRNKFGHTHDKISADLDITHEASKKCIKRLNKKLKRHLTRLRIRGSNFFELNY